MSRRAAPKTNPAAHSTQGKLMTDAVNKRAAVTGVQWSSSRSS